MNSIRLKRDVLVGILGKKRDELVGILGKKIAPEQYIPVRGNYMEWLGSVTWLLHVVVSQ